MSTTVYRRRRERQGTEAALADEILLAGEWGYATDTGTAKIGDGVTPWADLTAAVGSPGPQGPPGGTGLVGTLASRPAPAGQPTGTLYSATNVDGGTLYVRDAGGAWRQIAPGVDTARAGQILAAAVPATIAGVAHTGPDTGWKRVAELTTPGFTMPPGLVTVRWTSLALTGLGAATPTSQLQVRYTRDAWATSHPLAYVAQTGTPVTPFWIQTFVGDVALLPVAGAAGAAIVAPGDTVQVAVGWVHTTASGSRTFTTVKAVSQGVNPSIVVIAG